ncbi:hypothetical protein SLA2020_342750 [Shorea laevis]
MDLEVVGRHALLFDDDAMASFVNSPEALVEWNSLFIDRYDVRHLLSSPPPPRKRRRYPSSPVLNPDGHLESELDVERYQDLPPPSPSPSEIQGGENGEEPMNAGGYNAVPFSYGDGGESTEQKDTDGDSDFRPPFPVPESLLQKLPPTEKLHQIIARTATFVSKHGGQSEIVLRVKQGDNPTFGFLMPDHPLHPYFRFLVDHQELLNGKSQEEGIKSETGGIGGGGALSLLGAVYGSGEDEEGTALNASEHERNTSVEADSTDKTVQSGAEQKESSSSLDDKDKTVPKHLPPVKDKAFVLKRNRSISTSKAGTASGMKKENDSSAADKSRASALPPTSKVKLPVVEPPSDLKRVVDKIVEFIMKNGREFESVLAEQDVKHGRFPFLLPSNQYHPYYLEVLQKAEESKLTGKGIIPDRHNSSSLGAEKKASRESDVVSIGSDIPYDSDRKGKFKMVIGKSKKDGQDSPSKAAQPQIGVSVDAASAAAILQAATRGIKNPHLEILSKTSLNGSSLTPSSEGVPTPSSGGQLSHPSEKRGEPNVTAPIANAMAKTAAIAAAGEADSSEASLSKEQKLKAERLKRAKMFAAMIKSGAAPLKTEPSRDLSLEPPESGHSGSGKDGINLLGKEREGSSQQPEFNTSDRTEKNEKSYSGAEHKDRRSKRKYRSRSEQHEEDDDGQEEEAEEDEKGRDRKHSRKKRRSHHSSDHSRDRHKHGKRHSSSKHKDTGFRHKHDGISGDEGRHKRDRSPDDDEYQSSHHHHKHDKSSDDEHQHSRHRHNYDDSSDDEYRRSQHHSKQKSSYDNEHRHRRKSYHHSERETELEEGEIRAKSDQSKVSEGEGASREASVDVTKSYPDGRAPSVPSDNATVSDDLRAKIRAMLMATL